MKNLKSYLVFIFVSLLLSGIIDIHGLSHLLDGDSHENTELCEDCSFVIQQKNDINFILPTPIENEIATFLIEKNDPLVNFDFVYKDYLLHTNHYNRPPPIFS